MQQEQYFHSNDLSFTNTSKIFVEIITNYCTVVSLSILYILTVKIRMKVCILNNFDFDPA